MEVLNIIANVHGERGNLVPYRVSVPDFLPLTHEAAYRMTNDLLDEYVTDVWLMDDKEDQIKSLLMKGVDWGSVRLLEYDWELEDGYGGLEHNPYQIWHDVACDKRDDSGKPLPVLHQPSLVPFLKGKDSVGYAKNLSKEAWSDWAAEDLIREPCWMFYYAKNVCKGRLPEVLDNAMTMKSFQDSDDPWVKRYFSTKRYRVRNRKALAAIS